jgi:hypothetical protein
MLVDEPPASLIAGALAGAAATEARKRAALERQGLSMEEINEILADPDADEEGDGMDIEDD